MKAELSRALLDWKSCYHARRQLSSRHVQNLNFDAHGGEGVNHGLKGKMVNQTIGVEVPRLQTVFSHEWNAMAITVRTLSTSM